MCSAPGVSRIAGRGFLVRWALSASRGSRLATRVLVASQVSCTAVMAGGATGTVRKAEPEGAGFQVKKIEGLADGTHACLPGGGKRSVAGQLLNHQPCIKHQPCNRVRTNGGRSCFRP